ncbi:MULTISPECIES: galactose-1-phosphate uridylyltransferase [unclassified Pseudofrankia]|uniref:galactose-1-phosphate uridylyltransferase n=1 Tax=unclassified Pseudofrankia TaxID=2994372 RepID=UPI0008DA7E39|nr:MULTISPECIES: galactose-1-phosphate uridylyltransferase [unclassified Pseudofrankia]MDT3445035.1 galactose-1-phosphate uridylyltransferase [Pseudofrankia sp. BMG5.37]OHV47200.1 galactose-1-phosphate uridylyltransferase [Pseudofrankia sp. BMG5.36]
MTAADAAAPGATRTAVLLSDGRELIYFDDEPGRRRGEPDRRGLAPVARPPSQLRHDRLTDEWVVIAAHRQGRTHLPAVADCPLCPSGPARETEVPEDYDVAVFENRFPALGVPAVGLPAVGLTGPGEGGPSASGQARRGDRAGPFAGQPGDGRCEVVCFTADHDASFAALTPRRAATVLAAWTDRTAVLGRLPAVASVFVFENRGEEIGVTLGHPHGQIYAYPFVPTPLSAMIRVARRLGRCQHCEAVAAEEAAGARLVASTDAWVAFVPYAARWPFEVSIYPRRHVPDLPALDEDERAEFPSLYLDVLRRFDRVLGVKMPYIAAWEQAPVRAGRRWAHLRLRVFSNRRAPDRLKYLAGSESAMGVYVNDIEPEHAASLLRAAAC